MSNTGNNTTIDPGSAHLPVMLDEVMEWLAVAGGRVYVDCTLGLGGHAAEILARSDGDSTVLGIDRDAESLEIAAKRVKASGGRFVAIQGDFADIAVLLKKTALTPPTAFSPISDSRRSSSPGQDGGFRFSTTSRSI